MENLNLNHSRMSLSGFTEEKINFKEKFILFEGEFSIK